MNRSAPHRAMFAGAKKWEHLNGLPGRPIRTERRKEYRVADRTDVFAALCVAMLVAGWIFVGAAFRVRLLITAAPAVEGLAVSAALTALFGSLVMVLFPDERIGSRLRWVGAGLAILTAERLCFGYLLPSAGVLDTGPAGAYEALAARSLGSALLVAGLLPRRVPRFDLRACALAAFALLAAAGLLVASAHLAHGPLTWNPPASHWQEGGAGAWHFFILAFPALLSAAALLGAATRLQGALLHRWIVVAMVIQFGAAVDILVWSSAYGLELFPGDPLYFAQAFVVMFGGVVELRGISAQHLNMVAREREEARRLTELALLKANFTAMVAHELSASIAAIGGYSEILALDDLEPTVKVQGLAAIQREVGMLRNLVADVGRAAAAERADFVIQTRPIPLHRIVADAVAFAQTLPGDHSLGFPTTVREVVWADPERIGQVLRNLLSNAAKYSPKGTRIELRCRREDGRVRIEVVDAGPGINQGDMLRIFEKFGRGRGEGDEQVPGLGLGLYLSRRIVQAHGSDLSVRSTPGVGSSFGFELATIRS